MAHLKPLNDIAEIGLNGARVAEVLSQFGFEVFHVCLVLLSLAGSRLEDCFKGSIVE